MISNRAKEKHMTKGLGNILKQAQQIHSKISQLQEEMAGKTVEASSGGGMVTVVMNGKQEVLSLRIDPEVVNREDIEMLQDLIVAAVNEAIRKSQEMMTEEMKKVTGGLSIPGLF
jgi:hypothetical protein